MDITFLVDNNSLVGSHFLAEPGLSMHIVEEETRVLLDAGYSDAFLINARRMGISLLDLDWMVLSHGHYDHTWGLDALIKHYFEVTAQERPFQRPRLLAHPLAFTSKRMDDQPEVGMLLSRDRLSRQFDVAPSSEPVWLTPRLVSLGEIERVHDFEVSAPLGERLDDHGPVDDILLDDTALAYMGDDGLVVVSGCSHSGICNIVEQARRVTGVENVHSVVGGFHLQDAKAERLDPTTDYLAGLGLDSLYACHCTDLAAKISLARKCPIKEVGSGLTLTF